MSTRKQVVDQARKYLQTPFAHQGRTRRHSLDCVGLVLCVACDLGICDVHGAPLDRYSYRDYGPDPVGLMVFDACKRHLVSLPVTSELRHGMVICMRVPTSPSHVGIVSADNGYPCVIHAYSGGEAKCVEHILDKAWMRRIVGKFDFPGIE